MSVNPEERFLNFHMNRQLHAFSILILNFPTNNEQKLIIVNGNLFKNSNEESNNSVRIDIDKPLWDLNTYYGRWRHFVFIMDMRTIFVSERKLWEAKKLCDLYKEKKEPQWVTEADIRWAKKLRDSSFHPDTGQPLNLIEINAWERAETSRSMVAWQILNQAFNAAVNYMNQPTSRIPQDPETLKQAFIGATFASCIIAIGFNHFFATRGPLIAKWSPFFAVAAGNAVSLPIMRKREIETGIPLFHNDPTNPQVMNSRVAAVKAISECTLSRIIMAAPGMLLIPVIIKKIQLLSFYQRRAWLGSPSEAILVKFFLLFMIPSALAIYPETHSLSSNLLRLSRREYEEFQTVFKENPDRLYYHKGL
ncbi:sideroflexin-2-like [Diachasmimorpha longicaudata]|uniref:sideroflexin-2-like n=1 Tax=Diachasmimorpha longicaudata TaxID=58733 RepID=UPI0030B87688